ncbi:PREDICTED: flocculation protein FLO11-like [Nicrophorus vespilloides]|uniref:Flocculation protein FLO11-like n=1 Tax=Nicrophorus vespilloides TaxID=110193 RepID=A0ABM1M2V9_NICVS|nr:PREDICTED: flocculation protein FLO11-like [Nicrophorus vespilloides]
MIVRTGKRQDVISTQNMHHRIPITNLNGHLTCSLCKGYFVDATTIIECLHSFCRSCIVKYLQTNRYCPVCDVQVHKTKPLLNIRPDKTLQDIVYKLVPKLFQNEMQRRRQYYSDHPDIKPSGLEQCGEASYQHLLTPDESICISFNYHGNSRTKRYLRCPAAVSVSHLQKLIRAKYDLKDNHRVDILYNQDCLNSYLTLMDIAYIYLWRRKGPMEITYRIYENMAKRVKVQVADGEGGAEENAGVVLNNNNNSINHNDWKEVQLRISENGEMSVTGIQDCLDMLDEHIEAIDETSRMSSEEQPRNNNGGTEEVAAGEGRGGGGGNSVVGVVVETPKKEKKKKGKVQQSNESGASAVAVHTKQGEVVTNCSTKEAVIGGGDGGSSSSNNNNKRKLVEAVVGGETGEPPTKKSKPTTPITTSSTPNHSVGLQNLSNNHPLKKHSLNKVDGANKSNKVNSDIKKEVTISTNTVVAVATTTTKTTATAAATATSALAVSVCTTSINTTATMSGDGGAVAASTTVASSGGGEVSKKERKVKSAEKQQSAKVAIAAAPAPIICTSSISTTTVTSSSTFTRPSNVNTTKHAAINNTRPATPVASITLLTTTTTSMMTPSPGQKWGKASTPGPPSYIPKPAYSPIINVPKVQASTSSSSSSSSVKLPPEINTTQSSMMSKTNSSAVTPKSKPNSPMGYKTLRDPPKTWNPQIARPKPSATAEPSKNVRPAKFFKVRNNIPRYLGNPASGVKPLYQVQHNVEKEKPRPEIKRHSIVKIDPKTLKPVSERAPESSNLTNITISQPDLKISTSSVPIFNPLKLQSSPKSGDRKSPQSPKKSPTTSKRDKLNLSYTPPNPFIPNISSQFLYPSGPPGFPTYDPRYMAAYHSLFFGSRLPAPYNPSTTLPQSPHPAVGGLNLEMTSPRANSPKNSAAKPKKTKEEKSLQNAVEKLTKIKSEETKAAKKEERAPSSKEDDDDETRKKATATTTTTTSSTTMTTTTAVESKDASSKQVEIRQKSESNVDINNQNNNTIAAVDNGNKSDNNVEKKSKK